MILINFEKDKRVKKKSAFNRFKEKIYLIKMDYKEEVLIFNHNVNDEKDYELIFNDKVENIEQEDKKNIKLTTYKYQTDDYINIYYFVGYEISSLLGYKDTNRVIRNNVSKCNQLVFKDFQGVKNPKLDSRIILLLSEGVEELLIKTRKRITPDVLYLLKEFGIDTTNKKCLTKEQQTLSAIANVFKTEKIEDQFKVGKYYIDLFFPDYKIALECDELGHADRKPHKERERMDFINKEFEIDDTYWIRYNPDEYDFDLSKVIGRVYRKIDEIKSKIYKENFKQVEEKKEPEWKLQIEPITGKFTAPPKEYLLNMLKTKNISDIAKTFAISTNPVSKWLKQYEIKIKEYHNYDAPTKEDLLKKCEGRTQTEVADHYNVSNHIIRKWLSGYDLKFQEIKKNERKIDKKDLVKVVKETETVEEICEKLDITETNLEKLKKTHNIDKIPTKEELEKILKSKSKEDAATYFNTTRTTLRKWTSTHDLSHIRFTENTHKSLKVISSDGTETKYSSISELCNELKIGKNKVNEYVDTDEEYKGYKFEFI
jgi:transposase